MFAQVFPGSERLCFGALAELLLGVAIENRFAQVSRTAVHQQNQLLLAEAELFESGWIFDCFNRQQFSEVVASAERAESGVELRRLEFLFL